MRSKTVELKFMAGDKLVACVQTPPNPPLLFSCGKGGSVHRLLNLFLCHWLKRSVSKICARRRHCGCVVCAKSAYFVTCKSFSSLLSLILNSPHFP